LTRLFRRVVRLAEGQWGVIADWQLIECGVSRPAISRWAKSGRLHRIYPRVYAVGHTAVCTEGRLLAAVLYAGPGAALSHASAAHWWNLLSYLPEITQVTSPRRRLSLEGVRVHRSERLERVMHRGLPLTPVSRTLLDFAAVAQLQVVRSAVAEADFLHVLDLKAIDEVTGVGQAGSARLNRALTLHRPEYARTRSPLEDLFLDLCRRHRLPLPEVNVKVGIHRVDALWRHERVIVELDGGDGHASYAQMQRDRQRDLDLRRAGHSVRRYSWRQVITRRAEVAADIRRTLQAGGARFDVAA
jgi:very-short-patch-repair endonuclease